MRVQLVTPEHPDGTHYWRSLIALGVYEVLGIEADSYRLLNDKSEPVLYDPCCFRTVDAAEPGCWVSEVEDGVRYAYPPGWGRPGFFEDWHDGVAAVRQQFEIDLGRWYPRASPEAGASPRTSLP